MLFKTWDLCTCLSDNDVLIILIILFVLFIDKRKIDLIYFHKLYCSIKHKNPLLSTTCSEYVHVGTKENLTLLRAAGLILNEHTLAKFQLTLTITLR